jgi:hypothetical protein
MPRIAEFYGILIFMYHNDHGPAHFHARYGKHGAVIGLDPVRVLAGRLPPRMLRLVLVWASAHQLELRDNWQRAVTRKPLTRITPPD